MGDWGSLVRVHNAEKSLYSVLDYLLRYAYLSLKNAR
jgi:hypothetical protein